MSEKTLLEHSHVCHGKSVQRVAWEERRDFQFLPVCFKSHGEVYLHMSVHTPMYVYTHSYIHLIRYYKTNKCVYTRVCICHIIYD